MVRMFFHRTSRCAARAGSRLRIARATGSRPGRLITYDGERCSIVTWAASGAIAGTRVTAVAPLPITTTFLPVQSRSAGQCWGCTIGPRNVVGAGELRLVAVLVVVVAAAAPEEAGGDGHRLSGVLGLDGPARRVAVPRGADHPVVVADVGLHVVLAGGLAEVLQDPAAAAEGLLVGPGLEAVAHRVHVGVGADAGVAEEVPGAAADRAALQHGVRRAREGAGQVRGRADPGEARADDEDVDVFSVSGSSVGRAARQRLRPRPPRRRRAARRRRRCPRRSRASRVSCPAAPAAGW